MSSGKSVIEILAGRDGPLHFTEGANLTDRARFNADVTASDKSATSYHKDVKVAGDAVYNANINGTSQENDPYRRTGDEFPVPKEVILFTANVESQENGEVQDQRPDTGKQMKEIHQRFTNIFGKDKLLTNFFQKDASTEQMDKRFNDIVEKFEEEDSIQLCVIVLSCHSSGDQIVLKDNAEYNIQEKVNNLRSKMPECVPLVILLQCCYGESVLTTHSSNMFINYASLPDQPALRYPGYIPYFNTMLEVMESPNEKFTDNKNFEVMEFNDLLVKINGEFTQRTVTFNGQEYKFTSKTGHTTTKRLFLY